MKRLGMTILALGLSFFPAVVQGEWAVAKRITWTPGESIYPSLAVDPSGNPHVVWQDNTHGSYEIYYKKSSDGGTTWTSNIRLSWNYSAFSAAPQMAADSQGRLHVVWHGYMPGNTDVYYRKSTDGGASWSSTIKLTSIAGSSIVPAIAVDFSGNLHVVWVDDTSGNREIYYKKSTDGGAIWTGRKRLTWNSGESYKPVIAADSSGGIHVLWHDSTPGNDEIYYKKSPDGGTTWTSSQRLTWTSGDSLFPDIGVGSPSNIYAVWHDYTPGDPDIHFKKSTDGGGTWTASQNLTRNSTVSGYPAIGVESLDNLHVVWHDSPPSNIEVYYKKSTDGGVTWTPSQNLSLNAGHSMFPVIAVDSSKNLHVVWNDGTPGEADIYYRKFIHR
jgi:BNR repeat-containing family member